ncbi:MAG TPA: hypothetical protein VFW33_16835, partial [Gemmataceae bacterium]|nr:hypothetical protein [Gemmataceae bacterium]
MFVRTFGIVSWLLGLTAAAFAQAPAPEPPGGKDPVLRLEGGGPTALVTSLAFSPDGKTLYAAGFDKVVRVWALEPGKGFALSSTSYRVPIAAGADGVINAIAVSADGTWLAAAGQGAKRGAGSFRETGLVVSRSAMPLEMRRDEGTIYVFNTRTGAVRTLRGHEGPVLSLAFDTATGKGGPFLASAAKEPGAKVDTSQTVVRLWDLGKGAGKEEVAVRKGLPDPDHVGATSQKIWVTRPGLALWPGGALVAVACDDGAFRLWDWRGDKMHVQPQPTDKFNTAVAFQPRDSRGEKCFLATTLSGREGQLQTWYVTEKDAPARFDGRVASLGEAEVPRALTLFSAGADGKRDHAALVLRAPLRGDAFSLSLIDLANYREARRVSLWGGSGDEPVVAAAPHGRYLAVAGNPDNTILIYAIKDLFGGKTRPTQTLHSDGETMRYVGFVTQGKDKPGLLLNTRDEADGGMSRPRAPGKKGDVVFDFAARAVTDKLGGWKSDAPDLAEWDVIKTDGKSTTLHVEKKKARQGPEVTLEPGQEVT